ncbi:hypothetical protein Tco_1469916, partial [Tanacetum coccineum]
PPPDSYSAATQFGGVTDWYQEPRYCHVRFRGFHSHLHGGSPFEDLSNIGSSGVDGLPMMPEDPYAYVVAAFQASPSLDYVNIVDSDLEEDEEDLKEDPKEDPTDYPTDGGDDDESSDDDEDNDDDVEEDEDEEEEHPAPADFVLPSVHLVMARMYVRAQTPYHFLQI